MINKQGLELLESFEGCILHPYKCPRGIWTIGIGSTCYKNGQPVRETDRPLKDKAEAYELLNDHIKGISYTLERFLQKIPWKLTENQFSALICFAYNLGTGPIVEADRTMHDAIKSRDHKKVVAAFLVYNKATIDGQKKELPGLTRRREAEKALYLS